jgi:ABC-2 type transport system permease protein
MKQSLKAELTKLFTTRGTLGLLAGEVAVVLLTTLSTVASAKSDMLVGPLHEQVFFLLVSINVGIFSLIIGMKSITDEFRYSTIVHAFLSDPSRRRTLVAKAASAALTAGAFATISAGVMVAASISLASMKGGSLSLSGSDLGAIGGFVLANALWAVVGLGVGSVVRSQVPAIVGGIVWVLVIENLGSGFLGDAGAYMPGQAAYGLARALDTDSALDVMTAGLVFGLYAVVFFALGLTSIRRRDVA